MIVAARTVDCQALECGHGGHDHVVAIVVARDQAVSFGFGQLHMANEIPWPCGNKPCRHDSFGRIRKQNVASQLFIDEAAPARIAIKSSNHIIAIRPGIRPQFIFVIAVSFTEVHDIEPMPPPPFAVSRRGEQPIHDTFAGIVAAVVQKAIHVCGARWQADQIEEEPANERAAIRFR